LQEDKQRVFDSTDTVQACLELAASVVAGAELQRDAIAARLDRGYLDATTLMEYLIRLDVPQRTAHEIVGRLVAVAMKRDAALSELSIEDFRAAHPALDERVFAELGVQRAVAAFQSEGSTAPDKVAAQIELWRRRLQLAPNE
jgi:argininosuccinate lyase